MAFVVLASLNAEIQVGAITPHANDTWRAQRQLLDDVALDGRGGRSRERQDRWPSEVLGRVTDMQISRPKIVTPLRDAMRFVDDDERHAAATEKGKKVRAREPLGCDVDQLEPLMADVGEGVACVLRRQRRVDTNRGDTAELELVGLVLGE